MKYLCMLFIHFISFTALADYSISWYTIDSSGGTSQGGPYSITGTIGQPDAGYHTAGAYELVGGFWPGGPLCVVNLDNFAILAAEWLEPSCDETNDYCNGADLDGLNGVDVEDLSILAAEWLNICPFNWPLK